jgi:predicted anti-sigma-YlaC factor YlaD
VEADVTCRDVDRFVMDYLDGTLPLGVRVSFTTHVALCSDCRRYIDTYRKTVTLGRAAFVETESAPQVPEELVKAILASRDSTDTPRA